MIALRAQHEEHLIADLRLAHVLLPDLWVGIAESLRSAVDLRDAGALLTDLGQRIDTLAYYREASEGRPEL